MSDFSTWDGYELVDFGDGRKLERFGSLLLDRPSVAAKTARRLQKNAIYWHRADLIFDSNIWTAASDSGQEALSNGWQIPITLPRGRVMLELKASPAGHIGLFPEHLRNFETVLQAFQTRQDRCSPQMLNLFAYSGMGSLQCALAGFAVTHVDASKPAVQWAKRNYERNVQLPLSAVRFLVDDALAFAKRELRRGRTYDLICLDPPAYGHGPAGKAWQLDRDLGELVDVLIELLSAQPIGVLLAGHSDIEVFRKQLSERPFQDLSRRFSESLLESSNLHTADGRKLNAGYCHFWINRVNKTLVKTSKLLIATSLTCFM